MRATHFSDIQKVLRMSRDGAGYRQIAYDLGMSKTTVASVIGK